MPSPKPTMEKITTFLHKEKADCDGPVIYKRRRLLNKHPEPYCKECGYLMEEDPLPKSILLTLYGMMLSIFGLMVIVIIPVYLYTGGKSIIPGVLVGGAMIVSGFIIIFIDTWIEVKRLKNKREDLDVREG